MPHLTCNGITVATKSESFEEVADIAGLSDARGTDGGLATSDTVRKREFSIETVTATQANAEQLRRILEGDGQAWPFNNTSLSAAGLGPQSGTFTLSASGGKFAGRCTVGSGSVFEVALARRMKQLSGVAWAATLGWTLMAWKKLTAPDGGDGTTFFHQLATGSVVVTRGASANPASVTQYRNGVAGSYSMGNWIGVAADGDALISGHSNAGAAAAYDYSDFVVLPYTVTAAQALALYNFTSSRAFPALPFVSLGGDALPTPITARCRIKKIAQRRLILDGAFRNNAAVLVGEAREV